MLFLVAQTTKPSDWEQVLKIPIPFFTCLFIGWGFIAVIQLFVFEREYRGKLNRLDGSISLLEQQLKAKDNDLKRLQDKNDDLEKQLLSQRTPHPQSLLEPVSVVKVSEVHQEPPKLLPTEASTNKPSQSEFKTQALKMANKLYGVIRETKQRAGGTEIDIDLLCKTEPSIVRNTKYRSIVDSVLHYYSKDLHDNAVELKTKILVPEGTKLLAVGDYTNPQGVRALEAIAQDLKNISDSTFTQP